MSYEPAVLAHYDGVAAEHGNSPKSTMADQRIREIETKEIINFVANAEREKKFYSCANTKLTVLDIGCGNGYTLETLRQRFPQHSFLGVEYNDKLRAIAIDRGLDVLPGDIRDRQTIDIESVDALICQRVLINLLDPADQRRGLKTCLDLVKPGGHLFFSEVFASGLVNLNAARDEFGLEPIPPAFHNLPLPDDFFDGCELLPDVSPHKLSSHYFVSRVLHEIAIKSMGTEFRRNSHFVQFMSQALPPVGEYAPLRFVGVRKN